MDYRDYAAGACSQNFWFKGKLRLIEYLFTSVCYSPQKKSNISILNVGVGTGEDLALIARYGDVYAVDIDEQALALVSDEVVVEKQCADACLLPYENSSFDVIVSFDVIEHIKDDYKAVSEIYRVLKPGGYFLLTVPAFNFLFSNHDRHLGHYRRYSKKLLMQVLQPFKNVSLGYWFFFLFFPAVLVRLFDKKTFIKTSEYMSTWHITKFDDLFDKVLALENWLLKKKCKFPLGLTLYGVCRKTEMDVER